MYNLFLKIMSLINTDVHLDSVLPAFPELKRRKVEVHMETTQISYNIDCCVQKKSGKYIIEGVFPEKLLSEIGESIVMEGSLAHEFSHVALGHNERSFVIYTFIMGQLHGIHPAYKINAWEEKHWVNMERNADEETIRRGFGQQLFLTRKGIEQELQNFDSEAHARYYNSEEILQIMKLLKQPTSLYRTQP
jgi:hypothetical protein